MSAHKQLHYTESALLKVHNYITLNMENCKDTTLTLLDLTAAGVDTINQTVLVDHLSLSYILAGVGFSCIFSPKHRS